ncbi:MAG: COR domain-containing protein [Cyanobacteria bacterium P01_F01_bin.150]
MTQDELLALIEQAATDDWNELDLSDNQLSELPHEIGKLTSLQTLDFSSNQLSELPPEIVQLTSLQTLDLRFNLLSELPPEIVQLTSLRTLDLRFNQLSELPPEIAQLTSLRTLDLRFNQLSELPPEIRQLTSLQRLHLSSNLLSELPPEIVQLINLQTLDLRSNLLSELPSEIRQLTSLQTLYLSSNLLSELPPEIGQLTSLQTLYLSSNLLSELPPEIGQLTSLQTLDLRSNLLSVLPPKIGQLTSLQTLELDENDSLTEPPPETVRKGTREILNYFQQILEQGKASLFEAKFLIVGEGGAGKTSLAYKLVDPSYELDAQQPSTEGIDVLSWHFELSNGSLFQANIWDFGGQEIYHATHQFFLTKRSLYALVVDTRNENTDLYYWLSIIRLFSDDSPVLIIKNEKSDRPCNVNERRLRGEFLNLKETLATNLKTNRGLGKIQETIQQYISSLDHVGTALPQKWVEVRQALETDPRNYISLDEYIQICEIHGFIQRKAQLQLSDYLHDLGVCLHFQDDDLLRKTIILKPEWGTTAVYNALDTPEVLNNKGRFSRDLLNRIWSSDEYSDMQGELLQLMMRFKLCYEIPGRPHHYIAPQLLEPDSPDYLWDDSANLIFRYEYEFMPKGILTRLIVELHEYIEDQQLVWKNGAVFTNGSARAEVVEHYPKREILIRVSGTDQREWLAVITHELGKTHQSFERLQYKALVPCNCPECNGSQTPYNYPYKRLKKAVLANPGQQIQCQESFEMVSVQGLLDAVLSRSISSSESLSELFSQDVSPGFPVQDVSSIRNQAQKQYPPNTAPPMKLSTDDRLKLIQSINAMPQGQFEEMVDALNPPKGILPSIMSSQGSRASGLLNWAEGSTGRGLGEVLQVLSNYIALADMGISPPQSAFTTSPATASAPVAPTPVQAHASPAPPASASPARKEVFISYAWKNEKHPDLENIVDKIDKTFEAQGITLIRDKRNLGFKGRIKEFMEQIGRGNAVVVIISDKYLKSENCMFELVEIAANGDFYDRIFPIVLADAQIYAPVERIDYVVHWEEKIEKLDSAIKRVGSANLQGFRESIDLYTRIRGAIADLTDTLKDMNTLTPDIHTDSGFAELIKAIEDRLDERP